MRQVLQIVMYKKPEYASLTNLGCEFEFAKLDVRIAASSGSTTVQTYSRKKHCDFKSYAY